MLSTAGIHETAARIDPAINPGLLPGAGPGDLGLPFVELHDGTSTHRLKMLTDLELVERGSAVTDDWKYGGPGKVSYRTIWDALVPLTNALPLTRDDWALAVAQCLQAGGARSVLRVLTESPDDALDLVTIASKANAFARGSSGQLTQTAVDAVATRLEKLGLVAATRVEGTNKHAYRATDAAITLSRGLAGLHIPGQSLT